MITFLSFDSGTYPHFSITYELYFIHFLTESDDVHAETGTHCDIVVLRNIFSDSIYLKTDWSLYAENILFLYKIHVKISTLF